MHLLLTHRPGLRIELTDENPFSKYGEPVRVFHGPYVEEYYRLAAKALATSTKTASATANKESSSLLWHLSPPWPSAPRSRYS